MIPAPITSIEAERLLSLNQYNLQEHAYKFEFDELTVLASNICQTPIASIGLIEFNRLIYTSTYGLDFKEVSRADSICSYAINNPKEMMVVSDLKSDQRFHDNPLVTGEIKAIFYAGVPLVNEEGYALGTLCIIDNKPKELTKFQEQALKTLARQATILLELCKKNAELEINKQETEKLLQFLTETNKITKSGGWEFDFLAQTLKWSPGVKEIHEVPFDYVPNLDNALSFYKPGPSRLTIMQLVENAISSCIPYDTELEIITAKGRQKWVRVIGKPVIEKGKCVRIYGVLQDIHERKLKDIKLSYSEAIFRRTFEYSSIGMALFSPLGKWIKVNKSLCTILGYDASELLHSPFQKITHPDDIQDLLDKLKDLSAGTITSFELEKRFFQKNGNIIWISLSVAPIKDEKIKTAYLLAQIVEISREKRIEQITQNETNVLNNSH